MRDFLEAINQYPFTALIIAWFIILFLDGIKDVIKKR